MDESRYNTIRRLLAGSSAMSPDEKRTWLTQMCAEDAEMKSQVESLLDEGPDSADLMKLLPDLGALLGSAEDQRGDSGDDDSAARAMLLDILGEARRQREELEETPELPDRFGPYRTLHKIGSGGMGVVYAAEDTRLKRRVAVKVLPVHLAEHGQARARFEREATLLASMNHPNIATIYSLEEHQDLAFLTMELVEGRTLTDVLDESALPVERALQVAGQVAAALEAAHDRDVIHRDVKPGNVMVLPEDAVKVLDFGIAKTISRGSGDVQTLSDTAAEPDAGLTGHGGLIGTPGYMSPEQIEGLGVDTRADIWAFGCLLYECLTGAPAFRGDSARSSALATVRDDPELDRLPDDVPDRLRDVIRSCLEKDPARRLQTIAEARRTIQETLEAWSLDRLLAAQAEQQTADIPHNLPLHLTSFIGRRREITEIGGLLSIHSLVTLTGVGGCGKTRLSEEAARSRLHTFPDGVWVIELAPVANPATVPQTVAAVLGVREERGRTMLESVIAHLRDRNLLLVLDNCEHLAGACAELAQAVLRECARTSIMATSRETLGVAGECVYAVPMFEVVDADSSFEAIRESEAVQLFVERAALVNPGFELTHENAPAVSEICRRLDGIALALELAAARAKVLGVDDIVQRLDNRFRMLTQGSRTALPRHRTLEAMIAWSYDQLAESERALFNRLSCFTGGWSMEAAEAVCAGEPVEGWEVLDLLSQLVDKSLVERDTANEDANQARYRMLETVHQYACDRLAETGEEQATRARHRDHYLALALEAAEELERQDQLPWLTRLDAEYDNLRAALNFCLAGDGADVAAGVRLGVALTPYWDLRGRWSDGRRRIDQLVELTRGHERNDLVAQLFVSAGKFAVNRGDYPAARSLYEESLAIRREIGDERGIASSLNQLGVIASDQGDLGQANALYGESLERARRIGDKQGIASALNNLGTVALARGELDEARALYEESLVYKRELGDAMSISTTLNNLGSVVIDQGKLDDARAYFEESLVIKRKLGARRGIAISVHNVGTVAWMQGDSDAARAHFRESLSIRREIGDRRGVAFSVYNLGCLDFYEGEYATARVQLEEALTIRHELGLKRDTAVALMMLGGVERTEGKPHRAVRLLAVGERMIEDTTHTLDPDARKLFDQEAVTLRTELGDETFEREWAAGQAMSIDEAVALAFDGG